LELVATSYETLRQWLVGLNCLVKNGKYLGKLKKAMESKFSTI